MDNTKHMLNHYTYCNAGELYTRNKKVSALIKEVEQEIKDCLNPEDSNYLYGRLTALLDCFNSAHKGVIECLTDTKKRILELSDNEYFLDELNYEKGYSQGLEDILDIDRNIFYTPSSFTLFIYSSDEDIYQRYKLAFATSKDFAEYDSDKHLRYCISSLAEDICEKIEKLGDTENFAVCVVYSKDNLPSVETMQKLSFEKNDNVFLIKDKDERNAQNIIKKVIKATTI